MLICQDQTPLNIKANIDHTHTLMAFQLDPEQGVVHV